MTRYLVKIVVISFFILSVIVLKVNYVNAQNNNFEIRIDNHSKIEIKDYGVRGHVFPIIDKSLLEVIMAKLTIAQENGVLEKCRKNLQQK